MAFRLQQLKGGLVQILGLEQFLKKQLASMQRSARLSPPKARLATKKRARLVPVRKSKIPGAPPPSPLDGLVAKLEAHPRRAELVRAGKQKDQLLRSLIPLYLVRSGEGVTSGVTSHFWQAHGVKYAAPNAAKALREHKGYAKAHKGGRQITPLGIKYVEAALKKKK